MKLRIDGIHCGECPRRIIRALLRLDLGARINFHPEAEVRIEGRLSVADARQAIERDGFTVASVIDGTVTDAAFRARGEVLAL